MNGFFLILALLVLAREGQLLAVSQYLSAPFTHEEEKKWAVGDYTNDAMIQ